MNRTIRIFLLLALAFPFTAARAQDLQEGSETVSLQSQERSAAPLSYRRLLALADSLHSEYAFEEAERMCLQAVKSAPDSLSLLAAEEKLVLIRNAVSMKDFCSQPVVIARRRFALKDFFLYYPLEDRAWREVPNQLDSTGGNAFARATYIPENADRLFYSAVDGDGIRNIYTTILEGGKWSSPELVNESVTSSSDEIFPMLSPDGKSLYFASKGLYGMGGYDLYVSKWNNESGDWDIPVNLGFPYSSPADDFLFISTSDGKYSIFASNRSCPADSVNIYVLEYDNMPVRKAVSDDKEVKELSGLRPVEDPLRMGMAGPVTGSVESNVQNDLYKQKVAEVRALRDSIASFNRALDADRTMISSLSGDELDSLKNSILERELALPSLNDTLSSAVRALQEIEMDFLLKGVVMDPSQIEAETDREVVGASDGFTFARHIPGEKPSLDIVRKEPSFDYSFMILPTGRFAQNNTLPGGLIYQVQIFTVSSRASEKDLNGLSPVFERHNPASGKYTYTVGLFKTYQDVLANLNKVKKQGFKTAIIVAFQDGAPITIQKARSLEASVKTLYTVKMFPDNGQSLPDAAMAAIKEHFDGDIVRTTEGGALVYFAGPFDDRQAAQELVSALKAAGVSNVSIEESESR